MGWKIFDCFACAMLLALLIYIIVIFIQGIEVGYILLKLRNYEEAGFTFLLTLVAVMGVILVVRVFMRLREW